MSTVTESCLSRVVSRLRAMFWAVARRVTDWPPTFHWSPMEEPVSRSSTMCFKMEMDPTYLVGGRPSTAQHRTAQRC